jgi:hypothetical protein
MQCSSFEYLPRRPEETVLYRVIAEQLETFLARQQDRERPAPKFVHELPPPEDDEIVEFTTIVAGRVEVLIERRGVGAGSEDEDTLSRDDPGMAALYASSVRGRIAVGSNMGYRVARLGDQIDGDSLDILQLPRCATVNGFSVHANVSVPAQDRMRLERLCRYAARPAVATERLSESSDGRLLYRLKRPWRNGTAAVIFEPQDFLAKLAALVLAPRVHLVRFHGILGPAAAWRALIIPTTTTTNNNTESMSAQGSAVSSYDPVDAAVAEGPLQGSAEQRPAIIRGHN